MKFDRIPMTPNTQNMILETGPVHFAKIFHSLKNTAKVIQTNGALPNNRRTWRLGGSHLKATRNCPSPANDGVVEVPAALHCCAGLYLTTCLFFGGAYDRSDTRTEMGHHDYCTFCKVSVLHLCLLINNKSAVHSVT